MRVGMSTYRVSLTQLPDTRTEPRYMLVSVQNLPKQGKHSTDHRYEVMDCCVDTV